MNCLRWQHNAPKQTLNLAFLIRNPELTDSMCLAHLVYVINQAPLITKCAIVMKKKNYSALCLINVKKKMPHLDSCGQKFVLNFKRSFWKFCFNIISKLIDRIFLSLRYLASELETLNTRKEDVVSYSINHTRLKLGFWENTQHPKQ